MNINNLNLNLLRFLNALLTYKSVSIAAKRLSLSQPRISSALAELRTIYQDDLLARGHAGKMQLTPLAQSLKPTVAQAISAIESAFTGYQDFDPKTSRAEFNIGLSDYLAYVLLPSLLQKISKIAPNIQLNIHHVNYLYNDSPLALRELDLILGSFPEAPQHLKTQALFKDQATFVACHKHPILQSKTVSLSKLEKYEFVMVSYVSDPTDNFLNQCFARLSLTKRVAITVPHAMIALQVLPNTHYITHTMQRLAQPIAKQLGLTCFTEPKPFRDLFPDKSYQARQYWHKVVDNNPPHRWLRQLIATII